jgi:23S rRNA (adenine2030-N6)-methyltransferase
LWYPIKQRRSLQSFHRNAAQLESRSVLLLELLVREDDSPLRMNGSGLLLLNPPYGLDTTLTRTLDALANAIAPDAPRPRIEWLRAAA